MHFMFAPSSLTGAPPYLKIVTQGFLLARRFQGAAVSSPPLGRSAALGYTQGTIACIISAP
jgi:hypothetical protein